MCQDYGVMLIEIVYNEKWHSLETKPMCLRTAPDDVLTKEYLASEHMRVLEALEVMFLDVAAGSSAGEERLGCANCIERQRLVGGSAGEMESTCRGTAEVWMEFCF